MQGGKAKDLIIRTYRLEHLWYGGKRLCALHTRYLDWQRWTRAAELGSGEDERVEDCEDCKALTVVVTVVKEVVTVERGESLQPVSERGESLRL